MSKARVASRTPLLVSVSVVTGMIMASMASPTPAWAVLLAKAADWRMNERSGKMIDSSGHNGEARHRRRKVAHARVHKEAQFGRGEGGRKVLHAEGLISSTSV